MESRSKQVHIQRSDSHTDKHVQILMMNRKLMEDNLTFTPEVYDKLRSWKVLPETMVLDIQYAEDEDKVSMLINHLRIMGPRSFRKLCDVLDVTGNEYLGQHLRAEETLELESQEGFTKMLKDQYPQLKRVFNAYDLNLFAVHLHDQVNEIVARKLWTLQMTEIGRLTEQKKSLMDDDIKLYKQLKERDKEVNRLIELAKTKELEKEALENQIKALKNDLSEAHAQRKKETKTLIQSNEACERTIAYTQERLAVFDNQIRKMNTRIMEVFVGEKAAAKYDLENITVSRLEINIERLFKHIEKLEREYKRVTKRRKDERNRVFNMLQLEDSNQDLSTAYDQGLSSIQGKVLEMSEQAEILLQTWLDKDLPIPKKSTAKYYLSVPKPALREQASAGRASRIMLMLKESGQKCGQVTQGILELRRKILSNEHTISKLQHDMMALKLKQSPRTHVPKSGTPSKLLKTILKKESTSKSVSHVAGYAKMAGVGASEKPVTSSSPFLGDISASPENVPPRPGTPGIKVHQEHKKYSVASTVSFASETKPDEAVRAPRKKSNGLSAFLVQDSHNGSPVRKRKMSVVSRPKDLRPDGQKESLHPPGAISPNDSVVMQKLSSASDDIQRRLSQASVVSITIC